MCYNSSMDYNQLNKIVKVATGLVLAVTPTIALYDGMDDVYKNPDVPASGGFSYDFTALNSTMSVSAVSSTLTGGSV